MPNLETLKIYLVNRAWSSSTWGIPDPHYWTMDNEEGWSYFCYLHPLESLQCVRWKEVSVAIRLITSDRQFNSCFIFDEKMHVRYAKRLRALILGQESVDLGGGVAKVAI